MRVILSFLLILVFNLSFGQILPNIDSLIKREIQSNSVAAIAVAIIDSGKVVHLSADGLRDIENNLEATINTSFHIASVSKTVTNIAVFKLWELGKIDINYDVNRYLPFTVKNPHYSNDSITIRDLLNHRSGIKDDMEIYGHHWNIPNGDPTIALDEFMKDYLEPGGKLYKEDHYESNPNYNDYSYSNTGIALLGLIVENVSGMRFEDYCQKTIFKPMEMYNTSWFLRNLNLNQVAKTYTLEDSTKLIFKGQNGFPDYPAGQLRTSISDYAKFLVSYLNAENGKFILNKKTTLIITPKPRTAHDGFFTWFLTTIDNKLYYFHTGGDLGVQTVSIMDVDKKRGIIIFINSIYSPYQLLIDIAKEMWHE